MGSHPSSSHVLADRELSVPVVELSVVDVTEELVAVVAVVVVAVVDVNVIVVVEVAEVVLVVVQSSRRVPETYLLLAFKSGTPENNLHTRLSEL